MSEVASTTTETLNKWVNSYGDDLFGWAIYKTSSKEAAEDLVQETFLAAAKGMASFRGDSDPKTWLLSILNNKIAGFHKNNFKQKDAGLVELKEEFFTDNGTWQESKRPSDWGESDEHLLDNHEFKGTLSKCMQDLPGNWGAALSMKYLSEKKGKDICQDLGITETNYWQILHRAKLQLRSCLEMNWFKKTN